MPLPSALLPLPSEDPQGGLHLEDSQSILDLWATDAYPSLEARIRMVSRAFPLDEAGRVLVSFAQSCRAPAMALLSELPHFGVPPDQDDPEDYPEPSKGVYNYILEEIEGFIHEVTSDMASTMPDRHSVFIFCADLSGDLLDLAARVSPEARRIEEARQHAELICLVGGYESLQIPNPFNTPSPDNTPESP